MPAFIKIRIPKRICFQTWMTPDFTWRSCIAEACIETWDLITSHHIISHHNSKILASFIIYLFDVIVSAFTIFTNGFFFTMQSQANINAAQQCGDATCTTAIGSSLGEGAEVPVAAMGTTNTNLFAAAAGGVEGRGRPRRLRVEHMAERGWPKPKMDVHRNPI